MSAIPGTNVAAPVVPFDTADGYPTHKDVYGSGGYRAVADTGTRDAIPAPRRVQGMWVKVLADDKLYELGSDLTTWSEVTMGSGTTLTFEAGENLTAGTPVKVTANRFYATTSAEPTCVGVVQADVLSGFSATAVLSGALALTGLTAGSPYFVSSSGISATAPSTGYVIRVGFAVSSTVLLVNIEEPILLS